MKRSYLFIISLIGCLLTSGSVSVFAQLVEAAPSPTKVGSGIVNFYSSKYGTSALQFEGWYGGEKEPETLKDSNGGDILVFTGETKGTMVYKMNDFVLQLKDKNILHLYIYPIEDIDKLTVEIFLLANKLPGQFSDIKGIQEFGSQKKGGWRTLEVDLSSLKVVDEANENYMDKSNANMSAIEIKFLDKDYSYYLDHVYFYNKTTSPEINPALPEFTPYAPPAMWKENQLIPVYSDSYANSLIKETDLKEGENEKIGNNNVWRCKASELKIDLDNTEDISGMDTLYLDIYSNQAVEKVNLLFTDASDNIGQKVERDIKQGKWNRVNIPLAELGGNGFDPSNLKKIAVSLDIEDFFVDNIYFGKKTDQNSWQNGQSLNNRLGRGINLGDIFEFGDLGVWNKDYVKMIHEKGFQHIRMPIRWESFGRSLDDEPFNLDTVFLRTVKEVVDDVLAKDMKIIINMHHHEIMHADPAGQKERFLCMWGQIAEYFRYYPEELLFEILNEPSGNMDPHWNNYLKGALNVIRQTNPGRAVLVGTANGGGIDGLTSLELPSDDHLIVTVHYYSPIDFTHQGATFGGGTPTTGVKWRDTQSEREAVIADFGLIDNFSKTWNVPIHIGEFGVYEKADMNSRALWTAYVAHHIRERGYSSAYWDFSAKFGIYDPVNEEFHQPLVDALLRNSIPEPAQLKDGIRTEIYNSEEAIGEWYFNQHQQGNDFTKGEKDIVVTVKKQGAEGSHVQPLLQKILVEKGASYEVSFAAVVSQETKNGNVISYIGMDGNPGYTRYSPMYPFHPTTTEKIFTYRFTMLEETDDLARLAFDLGGGNLTPETTITISKITIHKIQDVLTPAKPPVEENIDNIFSSEDGAMEEDKFIPKPETIKNTDDKDVLEFKKVDKVTINLKGKDVGSKRYLRLDAYPGDPLTLVVKATYETTTEECPVTILSAQRLLKQSTPNQALTQNIWNYLEVDMTGFFKSTGGRVDKIVISNGEAAEMNLYLDHLYFYEKKNTSSPDPEPEPEPTPSVAAPSSSEAPHSEQEVISIFSGLYTNLPTEIEAGSNTLFGEVQIQGDNTWKLEQTRQLTINLSEKADISGMEYMRLDIWSPETDHIDIYLSDGDKISDPIRIETQSKTWRIVNIPLTEEMTGQLSGLKYIQITSTFRGTFYIDNFYFYGKDNTTGNSSISDISNIIYTIAGNWIRIESESDLKDVNLYDLTGQFLIGQSLSGQSGQLDLSTLRTGIYLIHIRCHNGITRTGKIIKGS